MKQGKTEKAVFAKLTTEKVELNAIGDLKKMMKSLESDAEKLDKALFDVNDAITKFRKEYNRASKMESELLMGIDIVDSQVNVLKKQTKELGLFEDDVPLIREAQKLMSDVAQYENILKDDFGKFLK